MSDTVNYDPLRLGLQLGAAGAATGLGWAAVHRAVRLHRGNEQQVAVVKPMLVGALIGTTLGTTVSALRWRQQNMPSKYASLNRALEKRALFDDYASMTDAHPLAATAGYMTPGLGSVMSAADAAHDFSRGHIMRGIGNALMVPFGLVGAGGVLKSIPRLAHLARFAQTAKGTGPAAATAAKRLFDMHQGMGRLSSLWQRPAAAMFEKGLAGMSTQRIGALANRGKALQRTVGTGMGIFNRGGPNGRIPHGFRNPSVYNTMTAASIPFSMAGGSDEPSAPEAAQGSRAPTGGGFGDMFGSVLGPQPEPQRYRGLGYVAAMPRSRLPFNGFDPMEGNSPYAGYTTD